MVKKNVFKFFLLLVVISLVVLPFYLLRNYFVLAYKLAYPDYSKLVRNNGLISILVLGKGGEGHTAPDLTDTMIEVFVSPESNKVWTLPLPRDIWIPETRAKINSSYYWDKEKGNENYELIRLSVGSVTGISPSYMVVVDFNMFEDLIDSLGGVSVQIENSFTDEKFPIPGKENDLCGGDRTYSCRYETISFEKGNSLMDGETALKFVRSRNSQGDEGTDIAREKRQQLVIEAIKNKFFSKEILLNPQKISDLIGAISANVETDIDLDTTIALSKILFESRNNINNIKIPEKYLVVSQNLYKYDYQYVFLPSGGSWKYLQEWLGEIIY